MGATPAIAAADNAIPSQHSIVSNASPGQIQSSVGSCT